MTHYCALDRRSLGEEEEEEVVEQPLVLVSLLDLANSQKMPFLNRTSLGPPGLVLMLQLKGTSQENALVRSPNCPIAGAPAVLEEEEARVSSFLIADA